LTGKADERAHGRARTPRRRSSPSRGRGARPHARIAQAAAPLPQIVRLVAGDAALRAFLTPLLAGPRLRIVLTGAGSSSFVGECLAPALARTGARRADAVPTTDYRGRAPRAGSRPGPRHSWFHFARSGNSPESVQRWIWPSSGMRDLLAPDRHVQCRRCLYRSAGSLRHSHAVLLPQACNDQSFAMTSSFTGMLLAAGIALRALSVDDSRRRPPRAASARRPWTSCLPVITGLVRAQFDRVVYLGQCVKLKGLAREASLKMLELDGWARGLIADAPLGFRHGTERRS